MMAFHKTRGESCYKNGSFKVYSVVEIFGNRAGDEIGSRYSETLSNTERFVLDPIVLLRCRVQLDGRRIGDD